MVLRPLDSSHRRRAFGDKKLAGMANVAMQRRAPPGPGRTSYHVVRARQTARGDALVEVAGGSWERAKGYSSLELPGLGTWSVAVWEAKAGGPRTSLVVRGAPLGWSTEEFKAAFLACNGDRFPGVSATQLGNEMGAPQRLKRRTPDGWTPSTSMRFDLPPAIAEAVLDGGFAVIDMESRPIRRFQSLPTICARCQRPGHKAAYCRNASHCRNCPDSTGDHATKDCPRARRDGGSKETPRGRRGRSSQCSDRSPTQRNVGALGASKQNE